MLMFEVEEQEECRYLVYHKLDTDKVSRLVLGMAKNNTIEGTVPFIQSQMNTEIQYRYEITGLQSLAEYLGNVVSKHMLFGVLEDILKCKAVLEEYMLDMDAVVLDSQYIFVQPDKGRVQMIVLPVEHDNMSLEQFFRMLIFSARYDPTEDGSYIASLLSYFNSGEVFSTVSFAKMLQELKKSKSQSVYIQTPVAQKTVAYESLKPKVVPAQQPYPAAGEIQGVQESLHATTSVQDEGTTVLNRNMYMETKTYVNPNLQSKEMESGSVYPGQQSQNPAGQNVPKYTNPNLTNAAGKMQTAPAQADMPKTYPGTGAMQKQMEILAAPAFAAAETENTETENTETGKVKKGLFGKKDKKEKPEKKGLFGRSKDKEKEDVREKTAQPEKKALSFKGIAIPGSDAVPPQTNAVEDAPAAAVPVQNVQMPVYNAPIQNFGETVDLKSYTQETSVLDGGQVMGMISPCLVRKTTKEQFFLSKEVTRIGRSRDNVDIYITDNTSIGRVHAVLYWENNRVYIEDQHSTNGTFLNDRKITGREELTSGSRIRLSNEEFEFRLL